MYRLHRIFLGNEKDNLTHFIFLTATVIDNNGQIQEYYTDKILTAPELLKGDYRFLKNVIEMEIND